MKKVAILRHYPTEGPGYFATFLAKHSIPWQVIEVDAGQAIPTDAHQFSGLVFMGGPMSVNDPLPWIPKSLSLIQQAIAADVPVLGHCLGGQLMAKALGGTVGGNAVKEIGWGTVEVIKQSIAADWVGDNFLTFEGFHWHGETFSIPAGATRLMRSKYCENQAFVIGKSLALQCHVEMTSELVKLWCQVGNQEIRDNPGPAVQAPEIMQENLTERVNKLNQVADNLYDRWISGLSR